MATQPAQKLQELLQTLEHAHDACAQNIENDGRDECLFKIDNALDEVRKIEQLPQSFMAAFKAHVHLIVATACIRHGKDKRFERPKIKHVDLPLLQQHMEDHGQLAFDVGSFTLSHLTEPDTSETYEPFRDLEFRLFILVLQNPQQLQSPTAMQEALDEVNQFEDYFRRSAFLRIRNLLEDALAISSIGDAYSRLQRGIFSGLSAEICNKIYECSISAALGNYATMWDIIKAVKQARAQPIDQIAQREEINFDSDKYAAAIHGKYASYLHPAYQLNKMPLGPHCHMCSANGCDYPVPVWFDYYYRNWYSPVHTPGVVALRCTCDCEHGSVDDEATLDFHRRLRSKVWGGTFSVDVQESEYEGESQTLEQDGRDGEAVNEDKDQEDEASASSDEGSSDVDDTQH